MEISVLQLTTNSSFQSNRGSLLASALSGWAADGGAVGGS